MDYKGERFINAPLVKVWEALQDAQTLSACFAAPNTVGRAPGGFTVGAPIADRVTLSATPGTIAYTGSKGTLRLALTEENPQMTRLAWVLDTPSVIGAQAHATSLLDAFQTVVAGPIEFGASGLAGAQSAATQVEE